MPPFLLRSVVFGCPPDENHHRQTCCPRPSLRGSPLQELVDVHEHKCYLQKAKTPEELREEHRECRRQQTLRARRGAAASLQTMHADDPSAADEDLDPDEPVPPLHVFFDIASMQVEGRHVPNLIEAETETDDFFKRYGDDCIQSFLQWLDSLTNNGKRPLTVIAHNFRRQ